MVKLEGELFYNNTKAIHNLMLYFEYMNKYCLRLGRVECNLLHFILEKKKPVTMKEICIYLKVSHSRITHLINSLEKKGYVRRIPGIDDRRVCYTEITSNGVEIANVYKKNNITMFDGFINKLPKEKIDPIYSALENWLNFLRRMIKEV